MLFTVERYKSQRFDVQYTDLYAFLSTVADKGYNEHFHWGRFEWMMAHPLLDVDSLDQIAIFRDPSCRIVGLLTYDTQYADRFYFIYACENNKLLEIMLDITAANCKCSEKMVIKANSEDERLTKILTRRHFIDKGVEENVLQIDLQTDLHYQLPPKYFLSASDFTVDQWKYQLLLHKGFGHTGLPGKSKQQVFECAPHCNRFLQVFAMHADEYCAHCGVWYTKGETAYIEPVVTSPEHRGIGLGKAVVYEAVSRAKKLGAKRAVVLSGQEFYFKIGFAVSSAFHRWESSRLYRTNDG